MRLFAVLGVLVMMAVASPIVFDDAADAAGTEVFIDINFDFNGGMSGPPDYRKSDYNTSIIQVSYVEPVKVGFDFKGWALQSNPDVIRYQPGDRCSPGFSIDGVDLTGDWYTDGRGSWYLDLIAVWEEDPSATDSGISFIGDYTGTGTAEDPFDGELVYTDFTTWTELNGCYFTVGTTISVGDSHPSKGDGEWSISEGFGLTINQNSNGLLGTFAHSGTIEITKSELDGTKETYRIYCVEPIPDLEFLSDPVADGVVLYHDEPAAPVQSGIHRETNNNNHVGGTD